MDARSNFGKAGDANRRLGVSQTVKLRSGQFLALAGYGRGMAKLWEDMTADEKLELLVLKDESTRQVIAGISARLDEVGAVIIELEKQVLGLQADIARQKDGGRSRPVIKT
jgi:hypothetical protein